LSAKQLSHKVSLNSEKIVTKSTTEAPARYHPLLVTFHWFIALFVFAELVAGFYIKGLPNKPAKWGPLGVHMLVGRTFLFLMIVRLITRWWCYKISDR